MPAWEQLASSEEIDDNIVSIGRVDCTKNNELCRNHEVKGYPTLYMFLDGERQAKYSGGRELSDLIAYVNKEVKKLPADDDEAAPAAAEEAPPAPEEAPPAPEDAEAPRVKEEL